MLWVIICEDNPNSDPIRAENLQIHRDHLQSQKAILVLAGATQTDDGAAPTGSCFVVNVDSRAKAKAFIDADPFSKAGVFKTVTIRRMRKGQWNPQAAQSA